MISIISKLPLYRSFRRFGFPRLLPFSLTVSVTNRCNSKCRTCNIWSKGTAGKGELTPEEYRRTFGGLAGSLRYITYSGGEPFLRKDFAEVAATGVEACRPLVVTIPTNGLLTEKIVSDMREIASRSGRSEIFVNLSLDGVGERHDEIRGVRGSFDRVVSTYERLRALSLPGVAVGFHTVISRFNAGEIERIYAFVEEMGCRSFAAEVAEERVELGTMGAGIGPGPDELSRAAEFLKRKAGERREKGFNRLKLHIRKRYYEYITGLSQGKGWSMNCYAGVASGQVSPDGEVWFCCMKGESVGNLRDAGYDFGKLWFGSEADRLRADIRKSRCYCPLANVFYTNYLLNI